MTKKPPNPADHTARNTRKTRRDIADLGHELETITRRIVALDTRMTQQMLWLTTRVDALVVTLEKDWRQEHPR